MKKVISFILTLVMLCSTFAGLQVTSHALSSSGSCGENVTYTFDYATRELVISGSGAMTNYSFSSSPFYNQTVITVIIDNGVTSIGDYAFHGCSDLTSITIPDSVTSIGSGSFEGCSGLTSITIPDSVTSIGNSAFHGCSGLTNITIPDSVTSIGNFAFRYCRGLTNITIPDSVRSIGYSAFQGCSGLTSITIPDSVTSIGSDSFEGCSGLTSITIPDSVTSIGDYAFSGCSGLTSITIPDSVTRIGSGSFYGCSGLTSITILNSVTSIGYSAFYGCSDLKELSIPCSAKINNHEDTFYNCTKIEKVTLTKGTGTMQNYTSSGSASDTYYQYTPWYISRSNLKELVLEEGITNIGSYAFYGCSGLTNITIPDSVTSIGDSAFSGCSGLTNITIPDSVTSIGDSAFESCSGLTNITIPDSVTSIGWKAFKGCSGLTNITIPDSVTSIGYSAFYGCSDLKELSIPCSVKINNSQYTFFQCTNIEKVTLTKGTGTMQNYASSSSASDTYYQYTPWYISRSNLKELVLEEGITNIGSYAFAGFSGLTSISIPDSVTSIGDSAFESCSGLTNITIPDSVTSIGKDAFYGCSGLTNITIPDSFTSIGNSAFSGCSGLTNITIPDSVTSIGNFAFYGCSGLTNITIPDSVTSIGYSAFYGCRGLTNITIPDSVTSIGDSAFYGCSGLKELTMPASAKIYNSANTFYNCTNIEKITLTKGTGTMQKYGTSSSVSATDTYFLYTPWYISRNNIKELVLEEGLTSVGKYAFSGCNGLTTIDIPGSVTTIGSYAFSYCSGLKYIIVPNSVTSIGNSAFYNCGKLEKLLVLGNTTGIKNIINSLPSGVTLYVPVGSAAEKVAQANGRKYEYLDADCANSGNHTASSKKYLHLEPTCTETGLYYYDCLVCGKVAKTEAIPALGHNCTCEVTVEQTCTREGVKTYTCTVCAFSYTEAIAKLEHIWDSGSVTTKPTCTEQGVKTYTCTGCSAAYTEFLPALGHIFKVVNHNDGSLNYVYCERNKVETLEAATYPQSEHNYANNTNRTYDFHCDNATKLVIKFSAQTKVENIYDKLYLYDGKGTQIGEYTGTQLASKTITVTGDKFSVKLFSDSENNDYGFSIDSIVATISMCDYYETVHTYDDGVITKDPICTETGLKKLTCQTCGDIKEIVLPATGHSYATSTVKPTCTAKGYTLHTCSVCNYNYKDIYTNALGHSNKTVTIKATIKANGKIVTTCQRCAQTQKTIIYYPKTIKFSAGTFTYNGKVQKPTVKVTDSDGKVIAAKNYTVSYSKDCRNIGQYTVKLTFKGNYTGTVKKTFQILPKPVTKSSTAPYSETAIKVSWGKVSGISGYAVQRYNYQTNKWVKYKNTTSTSMVVPRVSAKDTDVYVRIWTYKKVGGKVYYNVGSKVRFDWNYTKPNKPSIALKNTDFGEFRVSFNRFAGHQIQISDNKSFSNKGSNICRTFKNYSDYEYYTAASTKKYYVRAREYYYSKSGQLVVGPWSDVKTITTY